MRKCPSCNIKYESEINGISFCKQCKDEFIKTQTKRCSKCKIIKPWNCFNKAKNKFIGLEVQCKKCICKKNNTFHTFTQNLVNHAKNNSKTKSKELEGTFDITADFIKDKFKEQNGLCSLSGIPMGHQCFNDYNISIERIRNDTNYTKDNVTLIIYELNTVNQWTPDKIEYMKEIDISIPHAKLDNIMSKEILLSEKREGICRLCPKTELYYSGYCFKCYHRRSIDTILRILSDNCRHRTIQHNSLVSRDNTECTLTKDEMWEQLQKQAGKCYYSGINMSIGIEKDWRLSIERLDVHKGYTKENIVFICQEFNSGDHSIKKTAHEKKGSSSWSKEKVAYLRSIKFH